jgi:hypothetical protein
MLYELEKLEKQHYRKKSIFCFTSPQSRKIDIIEDYCLKVLTLRLISRTILREKNMLIDINAEHAYITNQEMK